jgi:hypothetical protein
MTTEAALRRLLGVLEHENAALAALDLGAAGRLAEEKATALAACDGPPAPEHHPILRALAAATRENRQRLEHALTVQARIIALLGRAAVPKAGYGPQRRPTTSAAAVWTRA